MAQWTSIEDETGMTYVTTSPHFSWENGNAAFRTDDVDVSAAVIDGRLLKVIVADNDSVEAIGFVAMREKTALSESDDLEYSTNLADLVGTTDLLDGEAALGDMDNTKWTYAGATTFATNVFTRTASGDDTSLVHDTAAVAGTLYKIMCTVTVSAGGMTPFIGAAGGTEITASGSYVQYIVAGDTTAFTMDFEDDGAGTITAMYVYACTLTGYTISTDSALTAVVATGALIYTYTAGTADHGVKMTLDDIFQASPTVGRMYKLTLSCFDGASGAAVCEFYNTSDELIDSYATGVTTLADVEWYFHYEEGMYVQFNGIADGEAITVDPSGWEIKQVFKLGTDALVIMNSDGDKYAWDTFEASFDKNSDDYTFDILEMQGGTVGMTTSGTMKQTFGDPDLLTRATSRDSSMEYPDHKDMEDFDSGS